jgi:hypothetical protein
VGGRLAGFPHARGAGAWLSASPRVQRLAAAHIVLVLGAALTAVAVHQGPDGPREPLALATATGPASAPVLLAAEPLPVHPVPPAVSRSATPARPQPKAHPKQAPPARGWAFWSARIRGCESRGRPDAPPDYKAKNPTSSASGAYQILDTTWSGRYGVRHASDATPEQQEVAAAELYSRHGTADWAASAACWRR